jgi:hypothetical protein
MSSKFVYGQLDGVLVILTIEMVEQLQNLWRWLRSARYWHEFRELAGDQGAGAVMQLSGLSLPRSGSDAIDGEAVCRKMATVWTPHTLMQLMSMRLPMEIIDIGTIKYCPVRGAYLVITPEDESRAVLALVSEGFRVDRDDMAIWRCLPLGEPKRRGHAHAR